MYVSSSSSYHPTPLMPPLFQCRDDECMYVCMNVCIHRSLLSTSIVMQYDLNQIEVGPVFDSTDHTAQLLILLFFAMTFSPGLPLLMPLMCLVFSLYFLVDKLLLCRHYQKPPQLGPSAIKVVTAYLPYAAILRLAVACWMYGNHNILYIHNDPYSSSQYGPIARHVLRGNVLPLFILMLLVSLALVLTKLLGALQLEHILTSLASVVEQLTSSISMRVTAWDGMLNEHGRIHRWDLVKSGDPNRKEVAGFTKDYFMFVKHRDEIPDTCIAMFSYYYLTKLDAMEVEDGWVIRNDGDFVIKVKCIKDHQDATTGRLVGRVPSSSSPSSSSPSSSSSSSSLSSSTPSSSSSSSSSLSSSSLASSS